jgi:hypothetical protein
MKRSSKLLITLLICALAISVLVGGSAFAAGPSVECGAIHVEKYHDLDENGERDPDEPGLSGWHFDLKDSQGNTVAGGDTNGEGKLSFEDLPFGCYTVCETLPEGWVNSDPGTSCQNAIIGSGGATPGPESTILTADGSSYLIEFLGTSNGGLTWTYRVTELEGKDLSHWVLGLCEAAFEDVVGWSPETGGDIEEVEVVDDPRTGVKGIKWGVKDGFTSLEFSFTLGSVYPVGTTDVGVKTGGKPGQDKIATGLIRGPHCGDGPSEVTLVFGNHEEDEDAITLASFTARAGVGAVTLAWETGTEVDNAGFNLYRATAPAGPYAKVNGALIAAQGDAVGGASYSYVDTPGGHGTFYYKLEDVDLNGVATQHGPVSATAMPRFRRPMYRPMWPRF